MPNLNPELAYDLNHIIDHNSELAQSVYNRAMNGVKYMVNPDTLTADENIKLDMAAQDVLISLTNLSATIRSIVEAHNK